MVNFMLCILYHDWKKEVSDHVAYSRLQRVVKAFPSLLENSALFPLTRSHTSVLSLALVSHQCSCLWFSVHPLGLPQWPKFLPSLGRQNCWKLKEKFVVGQVPFKVPAQSWLCSLVVSRSISVMVFDGNIGTNCLVIQYSHLYLGQRCLDGEKMLESILKLGGGKLNNL